MSDFYTWLSDHTSLSSTASEKLVVSLIVILTIWLVRRLVLVFNERRVEALKTRYLVRKASGYVAVVLALLIVGNVWLEGSGTDWSAFLGLASAGVAIALKDPLVNMAGWLFIVITSPFEVGDRVEIGDVTGDVIDIRVFQFTLLEVGNWVDAQQSTGRIIHVPNGFVFSQSQANFTKAFRYIWNEVPVLVTFESDWRKAKGILQEIAEACSENLSEDAERSVREAAQKYMIFYSKLTPTVYTKAASSGVRLTIRYLCEPRRRRTTEQAIWEAVLDRFAEHRDLNLAYETVREIKSDDGDDSDAPAPAKRKRKPPRNGGAPHIEPSTPIT